jgi:hypothetical protein
MIEYLIAEDACSEGAAISSIRLNRPVECSKYVAAP